MSLWTVIILDILVLYFFLGDCFLRDILPKKWRCRKHVKDLRKALRARYRRCCDLMSAERRSEYLAAIEQVTAALKHNGGAEAISRRIANHEFDAFLPPLHLNPVVRRIAEYLEVLVVSVGVAFALRSLLIQPFKIPTGSMQPTLYGIHYEPLPEETDCAPGRMKALFDYMNFSRRYVEYKSDSDGALLNVNEMRPLPTSMVIFPRTLIPCFGKELNQGIVFPADMTNAAKAIESASGGIKALRQRLVMQGQNIFLRVNGDEELFHGAMESGDHLFVNRMSLAYRSPCRGDVMVFSTVGITYRGEPLAGDFYIKRLIGMPGDTLKIVERQVWFKTAGATEFRKLDSSVHPSFAKVYSMKNGYSGHSTVGQFGDVVAFPDDNVEYVVPEGHYFLMGDNTENSLDCRFFGAVPRENLIGRPCFVWWPFSKRFGLVDRN